MQLVVFVLFPLDFYALYPVLYPPVCNKSVLSIIIDRVEQLFCNIERGDKLRYGGAATHGGWRKLTKVVWMCVCVCVCVRERERERESEVIWVWV